MIAWSYFFQTVGVLYSAWLIEKLLYYISFYLKNKKFPLTVTEEKLKNSNEELLSLKKKLSNYEEREEQIVQQLLKQIKESQ